MSAKGAKAPDGPRGREALMRKVEELRSSLPAVIGAVKVHLEALGMHATTRDADLKEIDRQHVAKLERRSSELKADITRLRTDASAKDSKIRELHSKFGFVVGTITERPGK